jgi:ADP-ribosyl-[dinitrogen reductase] hydrolase
MRHDRILGCLLAGAVGDALGAPVEFLTTSAIRARYGPTGITGYDEVYGRRGAITDDTQMTLFTAEALLGGGDPLDQLRDAYLRWLQTQDEPHPSGDGLLAVPELHSLRAPGNTCLAALRATRHGARGTPTDPINDSKGCGGVMRAAPAGLAARDPKQAFALGCDLAAITHGDPSGYLPAGALATAVHLLVDGSSLDAALDAAVAELSRYRGHKESITVFEAARAVAARGRPTPEDLEDLGGGWTGEEALAIAVCAALAATDLPDGLLLAVNHSGDSDSTGSLCGNLLGARDGATAVPTAWRDELELHEVIEQLADRLTR